MAQSVTIKEQLEKLDDVLRKKYLDIVRSLDLDDLKHFNKCRYKKMIMTDIAEKIPSADKKDIDSYAQCISNNLQNESKRLKSQKIAKSQHKLSKRKSTLRDRMKQDDNNIVINLDTSENQTEAEHHPESNQNELTNSILEKLDKTFDVNDTLSSTITVTCLDETYEEPLDDSITQLKTVNQPQTMTKPNQNVTTIDDQMASKQSEDTEPSECDTSCISGCAKNISSPSLRCNICMVWFHTDCVGISNIDDVGAWVCANCRQLPKTVQQMKSQLEILTKSTCQILNTIGKLSDDLDTKFSNLNDRLTSIANQNKTNSQSSTASLSAISHEIKDFRNEVDRKTNTILSKSQTILDKVKISTDLGNGNRKNQTESAQAKSSNDQTVQNQTMHTTETNLGDTRPDINTNRAESTTNDASRNLNLQNTQPGTIPKRELTFLTGSCLLKNIKSRFLHEKTRIKTFRNAKIAQLKETLTKMDLRRYKSIVLHIGGHDIDAEISFTSFREDYQSLLTILKHSGCKTFVSGLLPRGGTNMNSFNEILKELCSENGCTFIDNHDSFMMASGELPFEFFLADQVNLKFPGIRALVNNINSHCPVLPKHNQAQTNQVRISNTTLRPGHLQRGRRNTFIRH